MDHDQILVQLAKLNKSQRAALKNWFASTLVSLVVNKCDDGSASVECVSPTGLYGYAFVGPRGKMIQSNLWS